MFQQNNQEALLKMKKVLAFVFSLGLIIISVWFSQQGFGIESGGKLSWVGWFLGATVTVIELVFNTNISKLNPTLIAAGVLAYVYGMYTNYIGFKELFGDSVAFAIIVGLFVEVLPEPLFAWSIGVHEGGDVVGNIGQLFGTAPKSSQHQPMGFSPVQMQNPQVRQYQPQQNTQKYKPQHKPQHNNNQRPPFKGMDGN